MTPMPVANDQDGNAVDSRDNNNSNLGNFDMSLEAMPENIENFNMDIFSMMLNKTLESMKNPPLPTNVPITNNSSNNNNNNNITESIAPNQGTTVNNSSSSRFGRDNNPMWMNQDQNLP
mmetsp:Transcript_7104/g.14010  ORF Transcript_7104/g.14010 Transcript_7104/m.14010 type:complete len:119 (+) Transcript_7104:1071-1427(+)